jgi:hypothetical protein
MIKTTGCGAVPVPTTSDPAISPVGVFKVIGTDEMLSWWEVMGASESAVRRSAVSIGVSEIS